MASAVQTTRDHPPTHSGPDRGTGGSRRGNLCARVPATRCADGPPPAWHETATPARPLVAALPLIRKLYFVAQLSKCVSLERAMGLDEARQH